MAQLTVPQVTVAGNLTRDPELRFTQAGQPVASFSIASTPRVFNKDTKEYEDGTPVFTNCVLWGKPAENFANTASKGSRVIASGQLKTRNYEDKEGNPKSATELVIDEIGMSVAFTAYQKTSAPRSVNDSNDTPDFHTPTGDEVPW